MAMLVNCTNCRTPLQLPTGATKYLRCALCQAVIRIAERPHSAPPPYASPCHQCYNPSPYNHVYNNPPPYNHAYNNPSPYSHPPPGQRPSVHGHAYNNPSPYSHPPPGQRPSVHGHAYNNPSPYSHPPPGQRPSVHGRKHWQKGNFLGRGSFGAVYEGLTNDGSFFAVKEVSLLDQGPLGKRCISQLEQEISLLSQFKHENIVQYFGTGKDDSKLYIFLELVTKGSLANLYRNYNLGDSQVSVYTRQILNGLNYLHRKNVVHRDIKCANILVDATGSVKLADFGLAKVTKLNDLKSLQGTVFFMAPEVANQNHQGYGLAADIWSLGCTVLEMLTRKIPYAHLDEGQRVMFRIANGELPQIPTSLSNVARDFIFRCLQVKPGDRPTAAQLLDHPFVKL